jgi:hypothetical protein
MNNEEYKTQFLNLKQALEVTLLEGERLGKEKSTAFECGVYIGAIKAVIEHIEEITQ